MSNKSQHVHSRIICITTSKTTTTRTAKAVPQEISMATDRHDIQKTEATTILSTLHDWIDGSPLTDRVRKLVQAVASGQEIGRRRETASVDVAAIPLQGPADMPAFVTDRGPTTVECHAPSPHDSVVWLPPKYPLRTHAITEAVESGLDGTHYDSAENRMLVALAASGGHGLSSRESQVVTGPASSAVGKYLYERSKLGKFLQLNRRCIGDIDRPSFIRVLWPFSGGRELRQCFPTAAEAVPGRSASKSTPRRDHGRHNPGREH